MGKFSDVNIKKTNGRICDNKTCKFSHNFSKVFPIDFINDDIKIRGVKTIESIKPEVLINKTYYVFEKIDFILSRSINKYNGREVSGEIIIYLTEHDNDKNELYISIPVIEYNDEHMINTNPNDILRNKTLTDFYKKVGTTIPTPSEEEILTLNNLVIGDLFPEINSYYYRTEVSAANYNQRTFISYDAMHGIKISHDLYKSSSELTSKIKRAATNDYDDIHEYLNPLKKIFIMINSLYVKPPDHLIEGMENMSDDNDVFISCVPITQEEYKTPTGSSTSGYDVSSNKKHIKSLMNKRIRRPNFYIMFFMVLILILIGLFGLYKISLYLYKKFILQ
jgi:hypothetical protein